MEAGSVWYVTRHGRGEHVVLVPVPHEDGGYSRSHSRWILVSLTGTATWDNRFHDTPEQALAGQDWQVYADSIAGAFARMLSERRVT